MVPMSVHRVGRYEIIETLGRGAMGVVYLARDPLIDRQVALKTLRVDLDDDVATEFRERFLREARAAGRINHAGIVTIHDVGEDPESGLVFIAMEFIEGQDLKKLMASGRRFRPAEAARIAAEVAHALDYAHSLGVVHRDIKPANIILTRDGSPKITDFGIARVESSNLTMDGQFIGTPNFMSPEQITGMAVDGRSDLFSLGVVLFNLLTGQRPFAGETIHEVTLKVVQEPSPIPSTVAPQVPAAFNPIILKCLEKEPDRRFQSGAELARVLAALARSLTDRDPDDAASTGVFQPDLPTRALRRGARSDEGPPGLRGLLRDVTTPRLPGQPGARARLLDRLPLPEVLTWDVNPTWALAAVAVWAVLCFGWVGVLMLGQPDDPGPSPSDRTVLARHLAARHLIEAERLLAHGDPYGASRAAAAAIDQVPASPGARRVLAGARLLIEQDRLSQATRATVDRLVTEGRSAYRDGHFSAAAKLFEQALDLEAENELAASYLDLARERGRKSSSRADVRPTPTARPTVVATTAPQRPQPTPGTARITVTFNSPIPAGAIAVTVDGSIIAEIPFDFGTKGFLGLGSRGSGSIKKVLLAPSGRRSIGATLRDAEGAELGSATFDRDLPAGSDWTLRFDQPSKKSPAAIYLVKARS